MASSGCDSADTVPPQRAVDSPAMLGRRGGGSFTVPNPAMTPDSLATLSFDSIKKQYNTLTPILNGLFLTYDTIDMDRYRQLVRLPALDSIFRHGKKIDKRFWPFRPVLLGERPLKWGVIDSAGNIILPFVCDAVKAIDAEKGIFSVYRTAYDLHTGISRFRYKGDYFFFDKKGIIDTIGTPFEMTVQFLSDYNRDAPPIQQGPAFYLPKPYHKKGKLTRGAMEE
jgi:hypothetical protein